MTLDLRIPLASLVLISMIGCESRVTLSTPRGIDTNRASAREIREQTAINGILAGEEAARQPDVVIVKTITPPPPPPIVAVGTVAQVPPVPPVPPVPAISFPGDTEKRIVRVHTGGRDVTVSSTGVGTSVFRAATTSPARKPAIVLKNIRSDKPHPNEQAALTDALAVARIELIKKLQQLDPPITILPTMVSIRSEYMKRHEKISPSEELKKEWQASGLNPNRVWMEVDLEVSEKDLQQFRAEERVDFGLAIAGVLFVIALAVHGFLRLDAWSKGYLTIWLGIASLGLVLVAGYFFLA